MQSEIVYFYPTHHTAHALPGHPERPERVEAIVHALDAAGLWGQFPKLDPLELPPEVLLAVHTRPHLELLQRAAAFGSHINSDTYLTPASWQLALNAAGGACAVAGAVWEGRARRGFALSRPPGHHATRAEAMGFCLLNNIALAAEYLIRVHQAGRLAIVDIDLHHGNGTQDIFYERGDVLFISTHQHPLYPGTGALSETGRGPGEMKTINLPLPPFSGDTALRSAMDEVILPALARFNPEMLLVSAGMDPHWRDPLGHMLLTAEGYHSLIARLTSFADETCAGRIALVLEGGYDLTGGPACAHGAVAAMLHRPFTDPAGRPSSRESEEWRRIISRARSLFNL